MTTDINLDALLDDAVDSLDEAATDTPTNGERRAPYVAVLRSDELFVDHTYQRDLDASRVDRMLAHYDVALVGIVEVSHRVDSDTYAILDGQHRWSLLQARTGKSTPIPCRIHHGLTTTEEAELYHRLNTTRKQLTGWDRWVARRGAGDPVVLDIEACLGRRGLVVGAGEGTNVFRATSTATKISDMGGLALLDNTVQIALHVWPDTQTALDAALLHGLAHVLDNYADDLDHQRLVEALSGVMPRQITARASAARELHTGSRDRLVGHVIVERYNATKGPRLEPFFSRVKPAAKTQTEKAKREAAERERILAWAKDPDSPWTGATRRLSADLLAAYRAAHPAQYGAV